ncbi:NAD-dependent epimerase/dehydratase family protein [Candidatus Leptofilum sp.]|uniref:NAD-dependent epimerase/dehydratase family protein n=1 Tax=Candidatus Leptofilum sp. TaxID=3241576 RepID=UPI003B5AC8D8
MILITGATGFLGRHLVPRLVQLGHSLRAVVRPSSDTQFLQAQGVELAYADDITDVAAIRQACAGCEQIIHAAGLFRFWGERDEFWRTNVEGTTAVLQACKAAAKQHPIQRFIHISSIAVVGKPPTNRPIDETTPCNPLEPYQQSKLEAEKRVLATHKNDGLPTIILRPGAFYGPWGRYAFNRLFFEEPLKGWRIKVDNGRHITFPVFVPDVVQGVELALRNGRSGETYNICGESLEHNRVNAIVNELAGIGNWRLNFPTWMVLLLARTWTALSKYTEREPFYPINMAPYVFQDWHVSYQKAANALGFQPTPFAEGARQTLEWYWQQGLLKKRR